MSIEPPQKPQKSLAQLKLDLKRLKAKYSESTDIDIREALQTRIAELESQIADLIQEDIEEPEPMNAPVPAPPTPEQDVEVEPIIRQARVELIRKNNSEATSLLEKAEKIAPGSVLVLELLGDQLVEARKNDLALKKYSIALQIEPNNINIAKKHADLVFSLKARAAGIEIDRSFGESEFAGDPKKLIYVTAIAPGLGHILIGDFLQGFVILGAWIAFLVWAIIEVNKSHALNGILGGLMPNHVAEAQASGISGIVVLPVALALIVYVYAFASCKALASRQRGFKSSSTIQPPYDLPY